MKIVSNEDLRIETLAGAVIGVTAKVEIEVSDEIGLLALQMGAKQVGVTVVTSAEKPAALSSSLEDVLTQLLEEGDPSNFKADGSPKAAVINKIMGRTVATDERATAWESVLNS